MLESLMVVGVRDAIRKKEKEYEKKTFIKIAQKKDINI